MSSHTDLNRQAYQKIATDYANEHQESQWQRQMLDFLDLLPSSSNQEDHKYIIDVGCGAGDEAIFLAKHTNYQVIGLDLSSKMLQQRQELPANLQLMQADILEYHPPGQVVGLWARASLHHLSKQQLLKVFKNFKSYSVSDGIIYMINKYGSGEKIEKKEKYGHVIERYFQYFNPNFVETLVEDKWKILKQDRSLVSQGKWLISVLQNTK